MHSAPSFEQAPGLFQLLAHDIRWNLVTLLVRSDYRGQELVRLLKLPQNLVSYHLKMLSGQGLVTERRSNADERAIYYSLNVDVLRTLYSTSGASLHPALQMNDLPEKEDISSHHSKRTHVLFLCTHNSARSQMAEGILRQLGGGSIEVASAGSHPTQPHPLAIKALETLGIDISQQRSKHLDEMKAKPFDYVVTVCDHVREVCPPFPGDPERMHWSFADPAQVEGSDDVRYQAFERTAQQMITRVRSLLALFEQEKREAH